MLCSSEHFTIPLLLLLLLLSLSTYVTQAHSQANGSSSNDASCTPAEVEPSPIQHLYAEDGMEVSSVAFSSCYVPSYVPESSNFWEQVRQGRPDLWLWLGDNAYSDG